jgi:putative NIF3 family GTP cyclohydrolase 1 type 2
MLILFDNGTPRGLARLFPGHSVEEARARGWEELANGELIDAAEQAGFDVMVTTDKNIRYQQNLTTRRIALVVLEHSQWPMVKLVAEKILAAVNAALPGSYVEVDVPFKEQGPKSI